MYVSDVIAQRFNDLSKDARDEFASKKAKRARIDKYHSYAIDAETLGHSIAQGLVKFVRSLPLPFKTQIGERIREAVKNDLFDNHLSFDRDLEEEIGKKVNAAFLIGPDQDNAIKKLQAFMEEDFRSYGFNSSREGGHEYKPEFVALRTGSLQRVLFQTISRDQFMSDNLKDKHIEITNLLLDNGFENETDKFVFSNSFTEEGLEQAQVLAHVYKIASNTNTPDDLIRKLLSRFSDEDLIAAQKNLISQSKTRGEEAIRDTKVTYGQLREWQTQVYTSAGRSISWKKDEYRPIVAITENP